MMRLACGNPPQAFDRLRHFRAVGELHLRGRAFSQDDLDDLQRGGEERPENFSPVRLMLTSGKSSERQQMFGHTLDHVEPRGESNRFIAHGEIG